jgi:hypothetical protein
MALSKTITITSGLVVDDAYIRVDSVCIPEKSLMQFLAQAYKDNSQQHPFWHVQMSCPYDITGDNPIRQAYLYLKTLPEFASATDC